ncbi:integrase arm-type DNA-binding domain-containing protein [Devosia sp.]|uniref:tyrosine-type recombinase/integrase n=1 Tax=Devosia sp. TaxID=1871048 RepID=UPI0027326786|nr:integrase arm-type DNA-binding domain-containing protein [Devosia sp.]MDP2780953.1 tyrosine-type recombinase/integrase [Devosia sp.]
MGKLTDKAIQAAAAKVKDYKLTDGDGLYLLVKVNGTKSWRMKYRIGGKEKCLTIGPYPLRSLKDARQIAFEARKTIADGQDPSAIKQAEKAAVAEKTQVDLETVENIFREWFKKFSVNWVEGHASKIIRRLEADLFPYLGKEGIKDIAPSKLLMVLRKVEARGAIETAHRLLNNCGQVWRYAVATGRVERDITQDLKGAIPPAKGSHLGAITEPNEIGTLLRNIENYSGSEVIRHALKLAPLVFVRPGELRQAKWSEFHLEEEIWFIPAERMKGRRPHVVPLSAQAKAVLESIRPLTSDSEWVFPTPQSKTRCISDMALLSAIRRMGYEKEEMTAHGFRAMASTNLEQMGFDSRLIELQLAHADSNEIRAAYKREPHLLRLDERSSMMQQWADYLETLKNGAKVIPLRA